MPVSPAEIERAVTTLLQGIATDYPAPLEHSLSLAGSPQSHERHGE